MFAENVRRNLLQSNRRNKLRWIGAIVLLLLLLLGGWLVWRYVLQPRWAEEGVSGTSQIVLSFPSGTRG